MLWPRAVVARPHRLLMERSFPRSDKLVSTSSADATDFEYDDLGLQGGLKTAPEHFLPVPRILVRRHQFDTDGRSLRLGQDRLELRVQALDELHGDSVVAHLDEVIVVRRDVPAIVHRMAVECHVP